MTTVAIQILKQRITRSIAPEKSVFTDNADVAHSMLIIKD